MNESRIRIRNLSVLYEGQTALKDVSLAIPDRQITAIIGPSGCGKTTLLRSINRLVDLTDDVKVSGEVWVDGQNILDTRADVISVRKQIGLISQKPSPLPMSIYDNVAYGPRIHGVRDRKALNKIVQDSLQTVSLWSEVKDRLHASASKLSVGQQQRLCLARSLAVKPDVLLCDEPTSALDPASSQNIEKKLIELKDSYTIIIVTHILRQARRLADYVVFLYLGQLVEHGPAKAIFESPQEARTKAYISGEIS
ncbi:MAG: phosphate ABC transporter ATP-binding protein [Chloroflexi bacterium]|nr:phosphate ABC transporter ATP-binding protein [Chloroflexota bacterium]